MPTPPATFAEVFALGSELTTGAKLDTNSRWLSAELAALGIDTRFHHTAADDAAAMLDELRAAAARSDVILLTGGLGATADDLTRPVLAELAGVPLELHEPSLRHVEELYRRSGRPMPPANRMQAMVPAGGEPIPNPRGTAPGVWLALPPGPAGGERGCAIAAMPGVPAEMKPMFRASVAPRLPHGTNRIRVARVNLFGAGETSVEERLGDLTARGRVPEVGITAHEATITLRVVARGPDDAAIEAQFAAAKRLIADRVPELIFGEEDDTLPGCVLRLLRDRGETLATAEVGTGGRLAEWLTAEDDPLAARFLGGFTAPSAAALARLLGCDPAPAALAAAARDRAGATHGLFTPAQVAPGGGAGNPGGEDREETLAWAGPDGPVTVGYRPAGGPDIARSRLAKAALDLLRRRLAPLPAVPRDPRTAPVKAILAAAVVLIILAVLGWYTIFAEGDRAGVDVNPDTIGADVETVGEAAGEAGEVDRQGRQSRRRRDQGRPRSTWTSGTTDPVAAD